MDGEFWIDPNASGNPLTDHCEMTPDKSNKINLARKKKRFLGNEKSVCHCVKDNIVRINVSINYRDGFNLHPRYGETPGI